MSCRNQKTICVANMTELTNEHHYRRLWMAVRNLKIPRRGWLDEIADCLRDCDASIIDQAGKPFPIPYVDDIFDDTDMRWFSYYLKSDPTGTRPRTISRKLERLQLIDLYFKIRHPDLAKKIQR